MIPFSVQASSESTADVLDVSAKRSEDGRTLVLQVVNLGDQETSTKLVLNGFKPSQPTAAVEVLADALDAFNTADEPFRITPQRRT